MHIGVFPRPRAAGIMLHVVRPPPDDGVAPMPKRTAILVLALTAAAGVSGCAAGKEDMLMKADKGSLVRRSQVVEANILATHAYHVLLARRKGRGAGAGFAAALSDAQLKTLVQHQKSLLAERPADVLDWAEGRMSRFDTSKDLQPLLEAPLELPPTLPLHVIADYLMRRTRASALRCRALASLFQMMLDVARDGDRLQEMFALYVKLGLPVHLGQLGLPNTDEAFVRTGKALAARMGRAPYPTDRHTMRMLCVKTANWGRRHTGERTRRTLADELLARPGVRALIPKIRAMPAQRIAVIGHSFTMEVHWSSPSAFVPVATEVIARHNKAVEVRQWQQGGLSAGGALKRFYADALAFKPDKVLLVVVVAGKADAAALETMAAGFAAAGAEVFMFDSLSAGASYVDKGAALRDAVAARTPLTLIEVGRLLRASPQRAKFLCLDGVHMAEPWHRLMAVEWLKLLTGARAAKLPPAGGKT